MNEDNFQKTTNMMPVVSNTTHIDSQLHINPSVSSHEQTSKEVQTCPVGSSVSLCGSDQLQIIIKILKKFGYPNDYDFNRVCINSSNLTWKKYLFNDSKEFKFSFESFQTAEMIDLDTVFYSIKFFNSCYFSQSTPSEFIFEKYIPPHIGKRKSGELGYIKDHSSDIHTKIFLIMKNLVIFFTSKGSIDFLKWLSFYHKSIETYIDVILKAACKYDQVGILSWIERLSNNEIFFGQDICIQPNMKCIDLACKNGSINVLKWCWTRGIVPSQNEIMSAVVRSQIGVLNWCEDVRILPTSKHMNFAAEYSLIRILNWGLYRGILPDHTLNIERIIFKNNTLSVVWLILQDIVTYSELVNIRKTIIDKYHTARVLNRSGTISKKQMLTRGTENEIKYLMIFKNIGVLFPRKYPMSLWFWFKNRNNNALVKGKFVMLKNLKPVINKKIIFRFTKDDNKSLITDQNEIQCSVFISNQYSNKVAPIDP
ncbi:MAG: hypothetical protein JKX76_02140 [Colwellia sp.]|nr:hypothetical protein [Colwellia sp.]